MQFRTCEADEVKVIVHEHNGQLHTVAGANQGIRLCLSDNAYVDLEVTTQGLVVSGNGVALVVEPMRHDTVRINVL